MSADNPTSRLNARLQRQGDRLLDEAADAISQDDWQREHFQDLAQRRVAAAMAARDGDPLIWR